MQISGSKMASHQDSIEATVDVAEENQERKETPVKLVTGFLTDISVMRVESPSVKEGSMDWTTWQLLDSLFPTGGFAHSYGLETAYQGGVVTDCVSLQRYARFAERFVVNSLQNTAGLLLPFDFAATNPHHAPLFGVICGLLGVDAITTQRSYLYMGLRDILSASTRLNLTGPLEAAKLQHQVAGAAENFLSSALDISEAGLKMNPFVCNSNPRCVQGCIIMAYRTGRLNEEV
ncbi:hypothetical protein R1flu_004278 [Riccia fluitans]|uniref:Urease accessory protein UreF n=1 Tax=Riccia fluitans TaxID=41844 RepID=A0ABD1YSS9_9MARC